MFKRNSKFITILTIISSLSLGTTAVYAASLNAKTPNAEKKVESKIDCHKKCCNPVHIILEKKLGFTHEQINAAAKSGKTAFDLAREKGMTANELRTAIISDRSQKLDELVSKGKINKDKANQIKINFANKIQNWDGSLVHKHHSYKSK